MRIELLFLNVDDLLVQNQDLVILVPAALLQRVEGFFELEEFLGLDASGRLVSLDLSTKNNNPCSELVSESSLSFKFPFKLLGNPIDPFQFRRQHHDFVLNSRTITFDSLYAFSTSFI